MSDLPPRKARLPFAHSTAWSLGALVFGVLLGLAGHGSASGFFTGAKSVAGSIGDLWVATLQTVALPLALALTLAATANAPIAIGSEIGRDPSQPNSSSAALGVRALVFFLVTLTAAACFAALLSRTVIPALPIETGALAALNSPGSLPNTPVAANPPAGSWWIAIVPRNIFAAATRGDVFPLLLFVILFGLAVSRLPSEQRDPLNKTFQGISQAMLVMVRWILALTPLGVFALGVVLALNTGTSWARVLGLYLVVRVGVTLLLTLLLYPITAVLGRTTLRAFARAVFPAQIVAISTRSSLAALPALIAGGKQHVGFNTTGTDFVLPLSVSLFRVGTVMANPVKLFFLAEVYGVTLRMEAIVVFMATEILFSMSSAGIPSGGAGGGGYRMLPVFAAAGIPIEGVLILDTVETIPDIAETMTNVTGQMSSAAVLTRNRRSDNDVLSATEHREASV